MIPASFAYLRASSVQDAVAALADADAKVIAGGHSLVPMMKLRLARPGTLVDIAGLPLGGIADGAEVVIGSLATHAEIGRSSVLLGGPLAAAAECAASVGDVQVRNAGTIGGSVAHGDPASDAPAGLLALDARIRVVGASGEREIAAGDFFQGPFSTALGAQELVAAVVLPKPAAGAASAYASVEDPASGYPLAGAAALVTVEGGRVASARIGVTGVGGTPFRASAAEAAAVAGGDVLAAAKSDVAGADVFGDKRFDEEYRRHIAAVVIGRAVERAVARAQGGAK